MQTRLSKQTDRKSEESSIFTPFGISIYPVTSSERSSLLHRHKPIIAKLGMDQCQEDVHAKRDGSLQTATTLLSRFAGWIPRNSDQSLHNNIR